MSELSPPSSRWRRRLLAVGFLLLLLLSVHWWFGPIRLLQFSASDIHDYYDDDGGEFTGDFTRCIRARCSEDVFLRYAAQQGLTQRIVDEISPQYISWSGCGKSWWTPPKNLKGAFYSYREGGELRLLAYADGILHYSINVW